MGAAGVGILRTKRHRAKTAEPQCRYAVLNDESQDFLYPHFCYYLAILDTGRGLWCGSYEVSICITHSLWRTWAGCGRVFLTYKTRDKEGRRDYWCRIVDFKRIGAKWYMVIVLTFPVIIAMAILADIASCEKSPQFETLVNLSSDPLKIFYFLIFMLLFGPIPEELGWRGYVLDRLQEMRTALASSLILGIAWTFWHLPLFFMKGFYHHDEVGFGTPGCLSFCVYTVAFAILITWVNNNTRRSTLSAILFHFMGNFTAEAVTLSERADNFKSLLLVFSAVVVTIFWRPHTLTKSRADKGSITNHPT